MKYIVYCTTNIVNNKIYIGVHGTIDPNKFDGYIGCNVYINQPSSYMKPKTAFQYAVKKYGTDKFSRSILYIYDTREEALLKEKELVTREFIQLDTNYNMIEGGAEYRCDLPVNQFDLEGNLLKEWEHDSDVIQFFNCSEQAVKNAIHFRETLFGYYWSRDKSIDVQNFSKHTPKKKVYKYNKNGKLLQEFASLTEAAKYEEMTTSSLITAIQGFNLVNKSYYYSFKLYDEFKPKPKQSLKNKKFYLYTLSGEYLQEFKDIKELMKFMNVKSNSSVHDVINRRNGLYKDYQIKLEKFDKIEPVVNKNRKKKVDVYDKLGNFIKTCDSVQQSAKEFNAKVSCINRVLRGLANTTAGYVFKFHQEN